MTIATTDPVAIRRTSVQKHWLEGGRAADIAIYLGESVTVVQADIRAIRSSLYEENKATLSEHTEQSVAILRRIVGELWDEYAMAPTTLIKVRVLEQIRRTEGDVAKLRGLLQGRTVVDVVTHVKMYDFKHDYPEIEENTIPGEARILGDGTPVEDDGPTSSPGQPVRPPIPESSPGTFEHLERPPYDDYEDVIPLADGTLLDMSDIPD